MPELQITPPPGYVYAGCPTCGLVFTVLTGGAVMPWCTHHNSIYVWRQDIDGEWTQMVPVSVTAPEVTEREQKLAAAAYKAKRLLNPAQVAGGAVGEAWDTLADALVEWEER